MPDAVELMKTIKRAALDAVKASKPVEVCFGKVTSVSPLKILVEQKLPTTEVTVNWNTEDKGGGSGYASYETHKHPIKGRKKITVHNGLVVGDEVILIRQQGGQKYIVVDRIG